MSAPRRQFIEKPSSNILFFPFSDGGLLFREGDRRIWVLNPASTFVWCVLDSVRDADDLSLRYARTFSLDRVQAVQDVEWVLTGFRREGLLGDKDAAEPASEDERWNISAQGPFLEAESKENRLFDHFFRLGTHTLGLHCRDLPLGCSFNAVMEHLTVESGGCADTRVTVVAGTGRQTWNIYVDEHRWVDEVSSEAVPPFLMTLAFVRFSEALKNRLLFHAAVLEKAGQTVMLPGEAGSGKTTLAAALVARHGFSFYSDELAVLDVETLRVSPFPLPMSIKSGSVPVLEKDYPDLAEAPVCPRADGKKVRYLLPSKNSLPARGAVGAVKCIVFPRFVAGGEGRLVALGKREALQRLVKTGSSNRELTCGDVEAMIALVERVPCHEIIYSELEGAVVNVENLFSGKP